MKSFFPTSGFGGFDNDPCQGSSFQGDYLGLSLQTFQANSNMPFHGTFQRIDGWNGGGGGGSVIFSQGLPFAHRELLQSNAAVNPWPLIAAANHHDRDHHDEDNPQSRFELGFRVPARIYGKVEAAENHR